MKAILALVAAIALPAAAVSGGSATFVLDTPQSVLTISGFVNGVPLQQQGPGSLTATYSGSFLLSLTAQTAQFMAGGAADANTSGNWDPLADGTAGTSAADYGAQANFGILGTARFSVRNIVADGSSGPIALNPDLSFDANAATVALTSGNVAYRSLLATGTSTLVGTAGTNNAASAATLSISRNLLLGTATAVARIPVSATVVDNIDPIGTATITFNGAYRGTVTTILGDANFDKSVDLDDFTTLASGFGQNATYLGGDSTGDGTVNLDDFTALAANFGLTAPADAPRGVVPEPATAVGAAAIGLLLRRRTVNR